MTGTLTRAEIETRIVDLLSDMTRDWDLDINGSLGPDTRLVDDLWFESIDLIQLVVAIDQAFGTRGLPYQDLLMEDGGYVTEIKVSQLVSFVEKNIASASVRAEPQTQE